MAPYHARPRSSRGRRAAPVGHDIRRVFQRPVKKLTYLPVAFKVSDYFYEPIIKMTGQFLVEKTLAIVLC